MLGFTRPLYPINLIYLWNGGSEEGVLQVQLKSGAPVRIEVLKERLRKRFAGQLPDVSFSFEPSDIVSRVMSLGASTPIEVAVSGPNLAANREFAGKVKERLQKILSLRDVQFGQALDYSTVDVAVNRERADTLLKFTKIVAPFSGTITRRMVDVGAFIPAAAAGSP